MRPAADEMLTIAPPPAAFMSGTTAFMPSIGPVTLTAATRSNSALAMVSTGPYDSTPALLTSTVTGPNAACAASTAAAQDSSDVTSRCTKIAASPSSAAVAAPSTSSTSEHDLRTLGNQAPSVLRAHPAGTTGDDRDLAVESSHFLPPSHADTAAGDRGRGGVRHD